MSAEPARMHGATAWVRPHVSTSSPECLVSLQVNTRVFQSLNIMLAYGELALAPTLVDVSSDAPSLSAWCETPR
jgi:hypothetical protein